MVRFVRLVLDEAWTAQGAARTMRAEFLDTQLRQLRARLNRAPGGRRGVFAVRAAATLDAAFALTPPLDRAGGAT